MLLTRNNFEKQEKDLLMPYAQMSIKSRGRAHNEEETMYRTCYQRDIDRIIHSKAFRRLEYKTQVFVNDEGDHYRTRLTHTFEVAQVAESIARALGLNIDLTRAIALAHDLGHTPFGHAGESILNEITQDIGGFEHNQQSLRVVEELETLYPHFQGLNLSWEVREGLIKHQSIYDIPQTSGYHPEAKPTLEAQVVNVADELAYNCHDVEDALRAKIIDYNDLRQLEIWIMSMDDVEKDIHEENILRYQTVRSLKNILVNDLLQESSKFINDLRINTVEDVRNASVQVIRFSDNISEKCSKLSDFLYENFYFHYRIVRMTSKAKRFLRELFNYYSEQPKVLPLKIQKRFEKSTPKRVICDYIAGMTDRFAVEEYRKLLDPNTRV